MCCSEAVVEFEGQAGYALGVGEVGIESLRPQLHATRCNLLDLFALW